MVRKDTVIQLAEKDSDFVSTHLKNGTRIS
jgi:hypothetical protein